MNIFIVYNIDKGFYNLKQLLYTHHSGLNIIGESNEFANAVQLLQTLKVDILFIPVYIDKDKTGFDLLDALPDFLGATIFVTACELSAIKAFKYAAVHYLIQPINFMDLGVAIERSIKLILLKNKANRIQSSEDQQFTLQPMKGSKLFVFDDIIYLQANKNFVNVVMDERELTISRNLKYLTLKLSEHIQLIRVHKSYAINAKFITRYLHAEGGQVELNSKILIPVSDTYRKQLLNCFQ